MKKKQFFIIRTYTILWLLCSVCLESKAMNVGVHSGFKTNHDLISKLVKNTTFENLSMNLALTFLASSMHRELLSESQLKYEDELMKSYSTRLDLTFPEKLEIANIAGFANWEQYMEKMELIKALKVKLYLEFPELRELSPVELQNVIKEAVMQINITQKLEENKPMRDCFSRANKDLLNCSSAPGYYYNMARKVTITCIACVFTLYVGIIVAVEVATAGAATELAVASWNSSIWAMSGICMGMGTLIFGKSFWAKHKTIECGNNYERAIDACINLYKKKG